MEVSTFFTRLLQAPKPAPLPPPDSLDAFDAAWHTVKETLEHPDERQLARGVRATDLPECLKHIVDALVYEGNRTDEDTTGACLEYFLRHDLLAQLERLCEADRPRGVKAEVLRAVNNLVVLMSERFLVHNAVHRPLRRLLRSCVDEMPEERTDGAARIVGAAAVEREDDKAELEEDLVDLMCILCSRMRAYPPLLLIFFHDRGWLIPHGSSGAPQAMEGDTEVKTDATHFEFLLFTYLLRFVHREGRTGDFARAGLLFLFDIAFLTAADEGGDTLMLTPTADGQDPLQDARDALGEYILDGDFADVMAAGLGAAFSVLPNKLRVPHLAELEEETNGTVSTALLLGAKDGSEQSSLASNVYSLPSSQDDDVRTQLDLLLKLFGFVQDVLYRCRSPSFHADPLERTVSSAQVLGSGVADSVLDALQTAFVDNVLYPSILESSSTDGTAVAVLTYMDVILSNLEDGPVLHRILDVLMDADAAVPVFTSPRKKTGAMEYTPSPTKVGYYANETRYTLRDLVLDNLTSSSPSAATAALHILTTLLSDHCKHISRTLLTIRRDPCATALGRKPLPPYASSDDWPVLPEPVNAPDVHQQEPDLYGDLVPRLDDALQSLDGSASYASYLTDAHAYLEADRCWRASRVPLQFVSDDGKPALLRVGGHDTDPYQHALSPSDPLLLLLLHGLGEWFTTEPDVNVALTGALSALARCPNRSLAGWLLFDLSAVPPSPGSPAKATMPALYQILRELVRHVGRFRAQVDGFDRLLSERRQGLLFADNLEDAMVAELEVPPSEPFRSGSPPRKKSLSASIRSLWSPRKKTSTPGSPASSVSTPARLLSPAPRPSSLSSTSGLGLGLETSPSPVPSPPLPGRVVVSVAKGVGSGPRRPRDRPSAPAEDNPFIDTPLSEPSTPQAKRPSLTNGDEPRVDKKAKTTASLSSVLDNCIVLEEFIKELVAVVVARRAVGVDQVGFVRGEDLSEERREEPATPHH